MTLTSLTGRAQIGRETPGMRRGRDEDDRPAPRPADVATLLAITVCLQFVLPSKLVLDRIPLSLSASTIVALGIGALWFCTQLTTTLGAAKGRSPVRTALLGYALVLLLSFASSSMSYLPGDERSIGDHALVTTFALVFIALGACDGIRDRERLYFLLRVVVGAATCVALVGVLQFLVGFDATAYMKPPFMHYSSDDPSVLSRAGLLRVAGTTAHPIEFGVFCAMVLPLALHLTTLPAATRGRSVARWACVAIVGAGAMFSVSRSAAVSLACASLVLLLGWPRQRRNRMLLAAAGFLVVLQVLSPSILRTFYGLFRDAGNDDSVRWRTRDYATAQELLSQRPLLGRGHGTWYAPKHPVFDNQYLLSVVDTGIIGLVALLTIFAAGAFAALRVIRLCGLRSGSSPDGDPDRDLALSLAASALVVFPAFATFDFMSLATVATLAFVVVGMAGALLRIVLSEAGRAR